MSLLFHFVFGDPAFRDLNSVVPRRSTPCRAFVRRRNSHLSRTGRSVLPGCQVTTVTGKQSCVTSTHAGATRTRSTHLNLLLIRPSTFSLASCSHRLVSHTPHVNAYAIVIDATITSLDRSFLPTITCIVTVRLSVLLLAIIINRFCPWLRLIPFLPRHVEYSRSCRTLSATSVPRYHRKAPLTYHRHVEREYPCSTTPSLR